MSVLQYTDWGNPLLTIDDHMPAGSVMSIVIPVIIPNIHTNIVNNEWLANTRVAV